MRAAVPGLELLHQVVDAEAVMAVRALDQWVVERVEVTGGPPHVGGEDDRGVDADDVVAAGDHRPPPLAADVLLQLDAKGAVVPGRSSSAVDVAGRVDEPTPLSEV